MARLWLHFENDGAVRLAILHDNNWSKGPRVQMQIRQNGFGVRRFVYVRSRGDSGHESKPISDGSGSDSCHEHSSASSKPISQMGEPCTSDYRPEIPHDDPVHGDSGASVSQGLPENLSISYDQEIPQHPFPAGTHLSSSRKEPDDYQESSACPVSGTPEASPDGNNVSHILRCMTAYDLPILVKPLDAVYNNFACLTNPEKNVLQETGELSGEATKMNIDVQGSPQYTLPDTPKTPLAVASFSDGRESPLNHFPAGTHPSSSESRKRPIENPDGGADQPSKKHEMGTQETKTGCSSEDDDGSDGDDIGVGGEDHDNDEYDDDDEDVEDYEANNNRIRILQRLINFKHNYKTSPFHCLRDLKLFASISFDVGLKGTYGQIKLLRNEYFNNIITNPQVLDLCQRFWDDEEFGQESIILQDEDGGKITGSDGDNPVMAAEIVMLEGSSSGKTNVLKASDDPGSSTEAAEGEIPDGAF